MATANGPKRASPQTGTFRVAPPVRQRVADHVFETLARGILTGELKPGDALPTQRQLADQFKISALVVRQAIHRLEDLGLVRVRQGSATIILDPSEANDIRLVQLRMELAGPNQDFANDALENRMLFLLPMIELAQRRISTEQLAVLDYIVEQGLSQKEGDRRALLLQYWRQIAKATQNGLFEQQVRWWASLVAQLDDESRRRRIPEANTARFEFLARLTTALRQGKGAPELYLAAIQPLLDWFDKRRGLTRRAAEASAASPSEPDVEPEPEPEPG